MDLPDWHLAAAAAIILFAYCVVGVTGFGASITAVPLLVQFLPLPIVVAMMALFDILAGLVIGGRNRASIDRPELWRLLPFAVLGILLGATLLATAPARPLLLALGVAVLAYCAWNAFGHPPAGPIASFWAAPVGIAGGILGALFGVGGPLYTIFLSSRISDKEELRATMIAIVFISAILRLAAFVPSGVYAKRELLLLLPLLVPCVFLGLAIGNRLHDRLQGRQMLRVVWTLLVVSGVSLIWRNA